MPPEEELRARVRARLQGQPAAAPAAAPDDALRERVRARLYGQDVENSLPKMADVAAQAAQKVDLGDIRTATQEIRARFGATPEGARELTKIQKALPTLEAAEASPVAVQRLAERAQDPQLAERVRQRLAETQGPQSGWAKMSGLGRFGHVLGLPGTMLREGLAAAASDTKDFEPIEAIKGNTGSGEQFVKTIEDAAQRGGLLAKAIDVPLTAASTLAGGIGTAIGAAPAALADKISGRGGPDPGWALVETLKDSPKTTKGTMAELLLDPLTYMGFGGGAKGAVGVALKQGERIAPGAERFAAGLAKITGKYGGRAELPKMVEALAKKHGVPMAEVERVLGQDARYLGQGQMTVGLPFATEKATMEVVGPLDKALRTVTGGAVRAPEQLARRAMAPVAQGLYKAFPGAAAKLGVLPPDWGQNLNTAISREAAKARNGALQRTAEELEIFREKVASLAPHDKARRELIVKSVLDPDADFRVIQATDEAGPGEIVRLTRNEAGKQVMVAVKPKPGEDPAAAYAALSSREKAFVSAFADYQERQRKGLVAAGLLEEGEIGRNLLTDRYVPRLWKATEDGTSALGSMAPKTGSPSPLKARGAFGGRAAGTAAQEGIDIIADPFEVVGKLQPKLEAAKQKKMFQQWAASHIGTPVNEPGLPHRLSMQRTHELLTDAKGAEVWVPKEALAKMEQQFAAAARPNGIGGKALQWMNARFKGLQTMGTPRYVFTNILGDSTFMAAAGFRDARWFKRAGSLEKMADNAVAVVGPSRNFSALEIKRLLKENGIWKGGAAGRGFEIDPSRGLAKAQRSFQESAEAGARAAGELNDGVLERAGKWAGRRKTELLEDVGSLGWRRIGEKINDAWDRDAKAAFFMDRLAKGDAPNVAAQRTFEVLFDYADQNQVIKSLSNFMAFPVWRMKAMTAVPKTIARNPWTVPVTEAAVDLASDPFSDPAPKYAQSQTYNVALGPTGRKLVGAATEALGGGPMNPGYGVGVSIRSPLGEAISPMLELAQGNPDPMASGLSPFMVPLWEALTRQDYISRQPLKGPSPSAMFPSGMPGVPDALKAETDPNSPEPQIAWAARYLPQFFMSPQALALANQQLEGQYLGRSKPTAPTDAQRNALRWLGIGTGLPLYMTSPADRIKELQRDSQVESAAGFLKNTKAGMKRR